MDIYELFTDNELENGYDMPMSNEEYQAWLDEDNLDALIELRHANDILESIDEDSQINTENIDLV